MQQKYAKICCCSKYAIYAEVHILHVLHIIVVYALHFADGHGHGAVTGTSRGRPTGDSGGPRPSLPVRPLRLRPRQDSIMMSCVRVTGIMMSDTELEYKPPAVPSGAAQGAHSVPSGPFIFKLSLAS